MDKRRKWEEKRLEGGCDSQRRNRLMEEDLLNYKSDSLIWWWYLICSWASLDISCSMWSCSSPGRRIAWQTGHMGAWASYRPFTLPGEQKKVCLRKKTPQDFFILACSLRLWKDNLTFYYGEIMGWAGAVRWPLFTGTRNVCPCIDFMSEDGPIPETSLSSMTLIFCFTFWSLPLFFLKNVHPCPG